MSEEKNKNTVADVVTEDKSFNETEELKDFNGEDVSEKNKETFESSNEKQKKDKKSVVDEKTKRFLKENARLDRFYDGYYDDVIPEDEGEITNHKIDNETIKKVALVVGGGVILIVLSILMLLRG